MQNIVQGQRNKNSGHLGFNEKTEIYDPNSGGPDLRAHFGGFVPFYPLEEPLYRGWVYSSVKPINPLLTIIWPSSFDSIFFIL